MAHRLAPQASAELDDIWLDIARASGSIERADRIECEDVLVLHVLDGRRDIAALV